MDIEAVKMAALPMRSREDVALKSAVNSVQESDRFSAVYERSFTPLFRLATLLTGSRQEGEEIAQEAFVRWYARMRCVDDPDAYLRRVVVNLTKDRTRRAYVERRRAHIFDSEARASREGGGDPADQSLLYLVHSLPFRQRAAIVLRFYEGRSEQDIANMLGCRPGTVKSLLSRALDALRLEVDR